MEASYGGDLAQLTAEIVSAFVANNKVERST